MASEEDESAVQKLQRLVLWFIRPDHLLIFVAVGAVLPYYMHLSTSAVDGSLLTLLVSSVTDILGMPLWLSGNPTNLLLFLPGFLILVWKIARPERI